MAMHHTIGEFDSTRRDCMSYTECLQQYFAANNVMNAGTQREILLSACGAPTYQLIRNFVSPAKPSDKSFFALTELVQEHHYPPPSVTIRCFNFHSCSR